MRRFFCKPVLKYRPDLPTFMLAGCIARKRPIGSSTATKISSDRAISKIIYTKQALLNLREIRRYIERDNTQAAKNTVRDIRKKCHTYASNPYIGRLSAEYGENVRRFPCGSYVVFYESIEDGIAIVHVFHGARNLRSSEMASVDQPNRRPPLHHLSPPSCAARGR